MSTETKKPEDLSPLDKIALEAGLDEAAAAQAEEEALNPGAADQPDPAVVWALIPEKIGQLLAMAVPELRQVYTEQACKEWGVGMAAVSEKYGWDAQETLLKWAPELMLVSATLPLAIPTYVLISAKLDAIRAERQRAVPPQPAPAQPMKDINPMNNEPGNFSEPH